MPWFEAKERIQVAPNSYVDPGERFEYPRNAGTALVAANRADWADAPTADPGDEPEQTNDSEPPEEPPESSGEGAVAIGDVDFTDADGIGESSAEDIADYLEDTDIATLDELLDSELTDLPGVGESTAEDIEAEFAE